MISSEQIAADTAERIEYGRRAFSQMCKEETMLLSEKLSALHEIIADAKMMLISLQGECPHPSYPADYYGDYEDGHFVHVRCPDCGYNDHICSQNDDGTRNNAYYDVRKL